MLDVSDVILEESVDSSDENPTVLCTRAENLGMCPRCPAPPLERCPLTLPLCCIACVLVMVAPCFVLIGVLCVCVLQCLPFFTPILDRRFSLCPISLPEDGEDDDLIQQARHWGAVDWGQPSITQTYSGDDGELVSVLVEPGMRIGVLWDSEYFPSSLSPSTSFRCPPLGFNVLINIEY